MTLDILLFSLFFTNKQENFAVMADEATTMRDPFFYRWHMFIDDIFQKFKESPHVPPYTEYEVCITKKNIIFIIETSHGAGAQASDVYATNFEFVPHLRKWNI